MTNNTTLELDATSLSHDGRAVCRYSSEKGQQVIFVQGALPGQRIRARLIASKKNFAEAVCEAVLSDAPDARPAACEHTETCGGCALQTMPYTQQLVWKEHIVREALCRIGKITPSHTESLLSILPAPQEWGYRNKMSFTFGTDAQEELILGLRAKSSHHVTDIQHCLLMPQDCMRALDAIRHLTRATQIPAWNAPPMQGGRHAISEQENDCTYTQRQRQKYNQKQKKHAQDGLWRYAIIRRPQTLTDDAVPQLLVHIITAPATKEQRAIIAHMGSILLGMGLGITGFVHEERISTTEFAQGERFVCDMGTTQLCETLGSVRYSIPHGAFFQTNTAAATKFCAEVANMAALTGQECVWDMYCGVGAPGLNMAAHAKQLYGAEISKDAIYAAKKNAQALGLSHCHYTAKDVQIALMHWPTPHVVLLDPPRAGVTPPVLQSIIQARPQRIVYVSCNPATLARDIALLTQTEQYILQKVVSIDMFPQTPHVESCALLQYVKNY